MRRGGRVANPSPSARTDTPANAISAASTYGHMTSDTAIVGAVTLTAT